MSKIIFLLSIKILRKELIGGYLIIKRNTLDLDRKIDDQIGLNMYKYSSKKSLNVKLVLLNGQRK